MGGGGEKSNPLGRVSSALRDPSLLCVHCCCSQSSRSPPNLKGDSVIRFFSSYILDANFCVPNKANAVYSELNEFKQN